MSLNQRSLNFDLTMFILFSFLIIFGFATYFTMQWADTPVQHSYSATITTYFPGASPFQVENLITDKLERKFRELKEINQITSNSSNGVSTIVVTASNRNKKITALWDKLRNKAKEAAASFPKEVSSPLVDENPENTHSMMLALIGDGYTYLEMESTLATIKYELMKMESIRKVDFIGTHEKEIWVEFSNSKLIENGISPQFLVQAISSKCTYQIPGETLIGPERILIDHGSNCNSVNDLKKTSLLLPGKSNSIYLEDIAEIRQKYEFPPKTIARYNGEPAFIILITITNNQKFVTNGKKIKNKLKEIENILPIGLDIELVTSKPQIVEQISKTYSIALISALSLVTLSILLFLGIRKGMVVCVFIFSTILLTVVLMPSFRISLHNLTIISLIACIGTAAGYGTLFIENFLSRIKTDSASIQAGKPTKTKQNKLLRPLFSAILLNIILFIPFFPGPFNITQQFSPMGIVMTLMLLSILILSFSIIPSMAGYLTRSQNNVNPYNSRLLKIYKKVLLYFLRHRTSILIFFFGLTVFAFAFFIWKPNSFSTLSSTRPDSNHFFVDFFQPTGTDIQYTVNRVTELEDFLLSREEILSVTTMAGKIEKAWPLDFSIEKADSHFARLIVNFRSFKKIKEFTSQIKHFIYANLPDARCTVAAAGHHPKINQSIKLLVTGPAIEGIYKLYGEINSSIYSIPGIIDVYNNWGEWEKKLVFDMDGEQMRKEGIMPQDVSLSIQTQTSGIKTTLLRSEKELIPVIIKSKENIQNSIDRINHYVYSNGKTLPISKIAKARMIWQPGCIMRKNYSRAMMITVETENRSLDKITSDIKSKIEDIKTSGKWPSNYEIEYLGGYEKANETYRYLTAGIIISFIAFVLISLLFRAIRYSLVLVLTLPFLFIGIPLTLFVTGSQLYSSAIAAIIILAGTYVNLAMINFAHINAEKTQRSTIQKALIISSQKLLLPNTLTFISIILCTIPLFLIGEKQFFPMIFILLFGSISSVILMLFINPLVYSILFKVDFAASIEN